MKDKQAASGPAKVVGAARRVKDKTVQAVTDHPVVAEVVAATLVAAAAALKNPQKARQLAESAGEELAAVGKGAAGKGADLWQLALEIARRSVAAVGGDNEAAPADSGKKAKKAKKNKNKKKRKKDEKAG